MLLTPLSSRERFGFFLPADPAAYAFQNAVRPRPEHSIANVHESCTFATLQDALLPKPVSGKLQSPPLVMKHEAPRGSSPIDNIEGSSMKNQSRHPSHEAIVKTFRDLGLDDPELCRRLQDFSKPEIWPRQIARCDDVIITRSNTAPDEGDDDHRKPSGDRVHQDGTTGSGFRPTDRQSGADQSASGTAGQLTACRNPPSKDVLLHHSRISAEYSLVPRYPP